MEDNSTGVVTCLREAMIYYLGQKPLSKIKVTELVSKAGVARISFYRHYPTTRALFDDIVSTQVDNFIHVIYPVIKKNDKDEWIKFIHLYFSYIQEDRSKVNGFIFYNKDLFFSRFSTISSNRYPDLMGKDGKLTYPASIKINIILLSAQKWAKGGKIENLDQMADILLPFLMVK